eukprot:g7741.t1
MDPPTSSSAAAFTRRVCENVGCMIRSLWDDKRNFAENLQSVYYADMRFRTEHRLLEARATDARERDDNASGLRQEQNVLPIEDARPDVPLRPTASAVDVDPPCFSNGAQEGGTRIGPSKDGNQAEVEGGRRQSSPVSPSWLPLEPCALDLDMQEDELVVEMPRAAAAPSPIMSTGPGDTPSARTLSSVRTVSVAVPFHHPSVLEPQELIIRAILLAVQKRSHCILESPTGTGKTAALLCAALAAQRAVAHDGGFVDAQEFREAPKNETPRKKNKTGSAPQIIYCTRTKGQVKQVAGELKKSCYRATSACLTSRDLMCVNESVKQATGQGDMRTKCNLARRNAKKATEKAADEESCSADGEEEDDPFSQTHGSGSGCPPPLTCFCEGNLRSKKFASRHYFDLRPVGDEEASSAHIRDVEDLVDDVRKWGRDEFERRLISSTRGGARGNSSGDVESVTACPYWLARGAQSTAAIVICPYQYVFDPVIRKATGLSLKDRIVVVDEAHNIESECQKAGHVEFEEDWFGGGGGEGAQGVESRTLSSSPFWFLREHMLKWVWFSRKKRTKRNGETPTGAAAEGRAAGSDAQVLAAFDDDDLRMGGVEGPRARASGPPSPASSDGNVTSAATNSFAHYQKYFCPATKVMRIEPKPPGCRHVLGTCCCNLSEDEFEFEKSFRSRLRRALRFFEGLEETMTKWKAKTKLPLVSVQLKKGRDADEDVRIAKWPWREAEKLVFELGLDTFGYSPRTTLKMDDEMKSRSGGCGNTWQAPGQKKRGSSHKHHKPTADSPASPSQVAEAVAFGVGAGNEKMQHELVSQFKVNSACPPSFFAAPSFSGPSAAAFPFSGSAGSQFPSQSQVFHGFRSFVPGRPPPNVPPSGPAAASLKRSAPEEDIDEASSDEEDSKKQRQKTLDEQQTTKADRLARAKATLQNVVDDLEWLEGKLNERLDNSRMRTIIWYRNRAFKRDVEAFRRTQRRELRPRARQMVWKDFYQCFDVFRELNKKAELLKRFCEWPRHYCADFIGVLRKDPAPAPAANTTLLPQGPTAGSNPLGGFASLQKSQVNKKAVAAQVPPAASPRAPQVGFGSLLQPFVPSQKFPLSQQLASAGGVAPPPSQFPAVAKGPFGAPPTAWRRFGQDGAQKQQRFPATQVSTQESVFVPPFGTQAAPPFPPPRPHQGATAKEAAASAEVVPPPAHHAHYEVKLRIFLLHAEPVFHEIAKAAHSVILASGTMAPVEGVTAELGKAFSQRQVAPEHVHEFPSELLPEEVQDSSPDPSSPEGRAQRVAQPGGGGDHGSRAPRVFQLNPLSAHHVITRRQLLIQPWSRTLLLEQSFSSLTKELELTFQQGGNGPPGKYKPWKLLDLGWSLAAMLSHLPKGVLVFFPSYPLLGACTEIWGDAKLSSFEATVKTLCRPSEVLHENSKVLREKLHSVLAHSATGRKACDMLCSPRCRDASLIDVFRQLKSHVAFESQTTKVEELSDDHKRAVLQHGSAVMFGVMRAKASEGISFNDDNARAVVVVGLPNLPPTAKVEAKKQFNDQQRIPIDCTSRSRQEAEVVAPVAPGVISGSAWYQQQCFRAVNQALGRCIRHKDDHGCLVLFDKRWGDAENEKQLAPWLKQLFPPGGLMKGGEERNFGWHELGTKIREFFFHAARSKST